MQSLYYSVPAFIAIVFHFIVNFRHYFINDLVSDESSEYKRYLNTILLFYAADAMWGVLSGAHMIDVLYIDTVIYYVAMTLSVYFCCKYIIVFLKLDSFLSKALNTFGIMFCIFVMLALAVNHFCPIFFRFCEDGCYKSYIIRHVVLTIQFLMFGGISALSFGVALKRNESRKNRKFAIGFFGVCMTMALALQALFPLLPLYTIGLLMGTLVIQTFIHTDELNSQLQTIEKLNRELMEEQETLRFQKDELTSAFAIINGLCQDYRSIWWANKDDMKLHLVQTSKTVNKGAVNLVEGCLNSDAAMTEYIKHFVADEDKERMARQVNIKEVREQLSKNDFYAVNFLRLREDGGKDYNQMAFANADTADGKHLMVMGFRDINYIMEQEKKLHAERALRMEITEAKIVAEAANEAKTKFLQNMSHEIRTPLNAMFGFSQLLGMPDGSNTEEEKAQYNAYIYNSYRMLEMLISDIIDIADSEHGNYRIELSEFTVNSVCSNAIMSVEFRVPASVKLYMTTDFPDDYVVRSDERRIQQVLINYLTNACKNTQEGEIHLHISKTEHPGKITFSVTDTGRGVPPEKAALIFNRFTKLNQNVQGSGLGLSICQVVADKLGGSVYLDTTYTKGARFVFLINDER